jgi:hypothetical protein
MIIENVLFRKANGLGIEVLAGIDELQSLKVHSLFQYIPCCSIVPRSSGLFSIEMIQLNFAANAAIPCILFDFFLSSSFED